MVYDQLMTNFCTSAILILYPICASLRAFDRLLTICFVRFLLSLSVSCGSYVTVGVLYAVRLGSIDVVRVSIKRPILSAILASQSVKSMQLLKLEVISFHVPFDMSSCWFCETKRKNTILQQNLQA